MAASHENFLANYDRFQRLYAEMTQKVASKFGFADDDDDSPMFRSDVSSDNVEDVRVEPCSGMGNVLVACCDFARGDVILEEAPVAVVPIAVLDDASKLRRAAAQMPASLNLDGFESHIESASPGAIESLKGDDDLLRFYMVFRINGMQYGGRYAALCTMASKASHSCNPNAVFYTIHADGEAFRVGARALRHIAAGDQVTFSYMETRDDLVCPATVRQRQLKVHKYFVCKCVRCRNANHSDECRGFPCPCGGVIETRDEALDMTVTRYAPAAAEFECACGRRQVEPRLLDAELRACSGLEALLQTLGDLSLSNIVTLIELQGNTSVLDAIDALERDALLIGSAHWLSCRASLLRWRAELALAKVCGRDISDCSLLAACVDFVEARCPELVWVVVVPWVVEAARFLLGLSWSRALVVYPLFARIMGEGDNDTHFEVEAWYVLFRERAIMDLNSLD